MKNKFFFTIVVLGLLASPAQAELRRVEITVFGMD